MTFSRKVGSLNSAQKGKEGGARARPPPPDRPPLLKGRTQSISLFTLAPHRLSRWPIYFALSEGGMEADGGMGESIQMRETKKRYGFA